MLEILPIKHYQDYLLNTNDLHIAIITYLEDLPLFTKYEYKHISLTRVEHDTSTLFNLHVGANESFHKLVIDVSEHGYRLYTMPNKEKGLFNNIRNNKSIFYINCPDMVSMVNTLYGELTSKRKFSRRFMDKLFQVDRVCTNTLVEINFSKYKKYLEIKHSFCVIKDKERPDLFDIFIKDLNFQTLVLIDATTYICFNHVDRAWYVMNIRSKKDITRQDVYIYNIYRITDDNNDIFKYEKCVHENLLKKIHHGSTIDERVRYLHNNLLLEVTPSKKSYRSC